MIFLTKYKPNSINMPTVNAVLLMFYQGIMVMLHNDELVFVPPSLMLLLDGQFVLPTI